MIACLFCGVEFGASHGRKYCADTCKWRAKELKRKAAGYYRQSDVRERQRSYSMDRYRASIPEDSWVRDWEQFGIEGRSEAGAAKLCLVEGCSNKRYARVRCRRHYTLFMKERGASWADAALKGGDRYKERAKQYGVPYEKFSRESVFERDGWVCGICGEHIDRGASFPDPLSVSLDHIIPLAMGGGHVRENVQCSHLVCNMRKGVSDGSRLADSGPP